MVMTKLKEDLKVTTASLSQCLSALGDLAAHASNSRGRQININVDKGLKRHVQVIFPMLVIT